MTTATSATDRFVYDAEAAERAIRFFSKYLHHVKGEWAGQPLDLQDWAKDRIIRPLFGEKHRDGRRRYRTCYVEIPRKNAKSTIAAGIGLYLLFWDGEPGAEIYSAAADRDQAAIVFDVARTMVDEEPRLASRSEVYRRSIVVPATNSSYQVLSADAFTKHGKNAHAVIFDELHAQPNRDLWDVLVTSTGSRRQPVIFAITTAGYDRNSICWEIHDYACKVRDGIIDDPSFLPVIFAAPDDADWRSDQVLAAANPGLGVTVKREYLKSERARAMEVPGYQNTFKRLHLNIWTEQANRWLDMATWEEGSLPPPVTLDGADCFAGLDMSSTSDLTSLELWFPDSEGGGDALSFFWVPEENIHKRAERDRVPYDVWARDGFLEATEGNVVDYDVIRARINQLGERYHIREIAIDRWNSTQLQVQLAGDGFTVVPFGQGFASMTAPTKELERLVLERKLRHGGHPVLRWNASNVAVRQDPAGNLKIDKDKSTEKVDGMVALAMAIGRAMVHEKEEPMTVEFW